MIFQRITAEICLLTIIQDMKTFVLIGLSITLSWYFIELESDQIFPSMIAPLAFMAALAWLAGWLAIKLMPSSGRHTGDSGYGDAGEGGCGD